jgi:hypothetical protein
MLDADSLKLISDKQWRMSHLYYITNKHGEKVLFKSNDEQLQLLDALKTHDKHIILKARQLGMTTLIALHMLDSVLFEEDINALIITHGLDESAKIMVGKIHYAFDNLHSELKKLAPVAKRNTEELVIAHNGGKSPSSVRVSTSGRSGTYQMLHISEFGKICAKYPEKAREIITGALPAAEKGQVFIESTAEGQAGRFYEMSMEALSNQRQDKPLNPRDYQFHFFDWHNHANYVQQEQEAIGIEQRAYFDALRDNHGIELSQQQKYWYCATEKHLQNDMKREYPSYPEEAFEQAVEGAVYGKQFAMVDKQQRIMDLAYDAISPVYTAWDIGHSDDTVIWWYQVKQGGWIDIIDYYECNQEDANHYAKVILEKPYRYAKHHLPHDAENKNGLNTKSSRQLLSDAGVQNIIIIPRSESINSDISFCRTRFEQVRFKKCDSVMQGVKRLRNYQYAWNDKYGRWSDTPLHNNASHAADAFRYMLISLPKDVELMSSFNPIARKQRVVNNPKRFV